MEENKFFRVTTNKYKELKRGTSLFKQEVFDMYVEYFDSIWHPDPDFKALFLKTLPIVYGKLE